MDDEAIELIERLKNACMYNRFDEPGVYAEYLRAFKRYSYRQMDLAIDAAIEDDSRNVPPISALVKKYKEIIEKLPKDEIQNEEYCAVCDDKGYVLIKEKHLEMMYNGKPMEYEYVLYCPFCMVGRAQAYDGTKCKEHKSPYRIPPLTVYFDDEGIQALREANLKKREKKAESVKPSEEELKAIGKNIPDGWEYDMDELPF